MPPVRSNLGATCLASEVAGHGKYAPLFLHLWALVCYGLMCWYWRRAGRQPRKSGQLATLTGFGWHFRCQSFWQINADEAGNPR